MNYELRQFVANTAGGVSTFTIQNMIFYQDSGDIVRSGTITTYSGAKYNANGTYQAIITPGETRAILLFKAGNQAAANDYVETATRMEGRSGVLHGIEYTASGIATHTCSAVCIAARPISMIDKIGASVGRSHAVQFELVFDRLNLWS
jgi:hypothetical protein